MGIEEVYLPSVYVEWTDVNMLVSWLHTQEAHSNHQRY